MTPVQKLHYKKTKQDYEFVKEVETLELNVAAPGKNRIDRKEILFKNPASFVLPGAMNPEKGVLQPKPPKELRENMKNLRKKNDPNRKPKKII